MSVNIAVKISLISQVGRWSAPGVSGVYLTFPSERIIFAVSGKVVSSWRTETKTDTEATRNTCLLDVTG